jgi:ferric iron reductase protein FhuF
MTQGRPGEFPHPAAHRLSALLPPSAGIPLYGMSLAGPAAFARRATDPPVLPDGLTRALAKFGRGWHDPDPRAVATQFSKYWFRAVIPPVLVCAAASRAAPVVDADGLRLDTDGAGIPHLLARDDPAIAHAPADGDALVEGLFARHLDHVVDLLSQRSGLAPRVFWSNAANVVAWYLDNLRDEPATAAGAARLAARWSDAARHPRFAGHNPLHMPYADPADAGARAGRRRRICCARYLSADCALCETCPLSSAPAARSAKR